jgi:protocatechuate 3,4-dioxygenase beta subunit
MKENPMKKIIPAITAFGVIALPVIAAALSSGINTGETVGAFNPHHVTGPNKGTNTCPVCTYGNRPMVQMWVNGDKLANVKAAASLLNERVVAEKDKSQLKGFIIFVTDKQKAPELAKVLAKIAKDLNANDIALAWIDRNDSAITDYKVNTKPEVKNTIFVYRDREVKTKYVNLKLDKNGLGDLSKAIDGITK